MSKYRQLLFVICWVLICNLAIIFGSMALIQLKNIATLQQKIATLQKIPESSIKCKDYCGQDIIEIGDMCCNGMLNRCRRKNICIQDNVSQINDQIHSLDQLFYYYVTAMLIAFGLILLLACLFCKMIRRERATNGLLSDSDLQQSSLSSNRVELNECLLLQKDVTCSICLQILEEQRVVQLSCRHMFHRRCIQRWISLKNNCPTCRSPHL